MVTVNEKKIDSVINPIIKKKIVFKDGGGEFESLSEILLEPENGFFQYPLFKSSYTMGTEQYYFAPGFLFTSGIMEFCQKKEAFWVLDVVSSYVPNLSGVIAKKGDGSYKLIDNPCGVDNFLMFWFFVKDGKCFVSVESEVTGKNKTIAYQTIPFTDLDISARFWLVDGVLMCPEEY